MSITNGQTATAADFITSSAGAGSSGQVPKLNASGKVDKTFPMRWGCRAKQTGTTSVTSTYGAIAFAGKDFDDDTMHDNVTNNSRITIKTAGTYLVGACISTATGANEGVGVQLRLNGTTIIAYGGGGVSSSWIGGGALTTVRVFAANDYIEVLAAKNNAANTSGDEATNFWAILLQST